MMKQAAIVFWSDCFVLIDSDAVSNHTIDSIQTATTRYRLPLSFCNVVRACADWIGQKKNNVNLWLNGVVNKGCSSDFSSRCFFPNVFRCWPILCPFSFPICSAVIYSKGSDEMWRTFCPSQRRKSRSIQCRLPIPELRYIYVLNTILFDLSWPLRTSEFDRPKSPLFGKKPHPFQSLIHLNHQKIRIDWWNKKKTGDWHIKRGWAKETTKSRPLSFFEQCRNQCRRNEISPLQRPSPLPTNDKKIYWKASIENKLTLMKEFRFPFFSRY